MEKFRVSPITYGIEMNSPPEIISESLVLFWYFSKIISNKIVAINIKMPAEKELKYGEFPKNLINKANINLPDEIYTKYSFALVILFSSYIDKV